MFKLALAMLNGINDTAREANQPGLGEETQTANLRLRMVSKNHVRAPCDRTLSSLPPCRARSRCH